MIKKAFKFYITDWFTLIPSDGTTTEKGMWVLAALLAGAAFVVLLPVLVLVQAICYLTGKLVEFIESKK